MTHKASAPRCDLASDQGVSRNEGNCTGYTQNGGEKNREAADGVEVKSPEGTF